MRVCLYLSPAILSGFIFVTQTDAISETGIRMVLNHWCAMVPGVRGRPRTQRCSVTSGLRPRDNACAQLGDGDVDANLHQFAQAKHPLNHRTLLSQVNLMAKIIRLHFALPSCFWDGAHAHAHSPAGVQHGRDARGVPVLPTQIRLKS